MTVTPEFVCQVQEYTARAYRFSRGVTAQGHDRAVDAQRAAAAVSEVARYAYSIFLDPKLSLDAVK